ITIMTSMTRTKRMRNSSPKLMELIMDTFLPVCGRVSQDLTGGRTGVRSKPVRYRVQSQVESCSLNINSVIRVERLARFQHTISHVEQLTYACHPDRHLALAPWQQPSTQLGDERIAAMG